MENPAGVDPSRFYGRQVKVHYNLHRCPRGRDPRPDEDCWVVSTKQAGGWKVAGYVPSLLIADAEFKVSEAGVDRIRDQGVRSVIAWILGTAADPSSREARLAMGDRRAFANWAGVGFNPFKAYTFYAYESGRPVLAAPWAYVSGRKAVARLSAAAPVAFDVGDRVGFVDDDGNRRTGEVIRVGKRQIVVDDGEFEWGLSPANLERRNPSRVVQLEELAASLGGTVDY
jgi:hypothetical protein